MNKEFLNESEQVFVDLVTERMLREGPIPTLKGKQKAEFEKEFNRFKQITGMINWPGYIEVYKKVILWFMAWGADNLPNLNKVTDPDELDFQHEQPETDLDADIEMEWNSFNKYLHESGEESEDVVCLNWNSFADVARYFYELHNHALEEAAQHVYESWMGGTIDDVRRDIVELGKALNAIKEEKK